MNLSDLAAMGARPRCALLSLVLPDALPVSVLDGIVEGRKAFGNVMKYLLMGTSSNFGNMFSMAVSAALLPFLHQCEVRITE